LKQALTEKEAQIKGLRYAIDELQGGYESFRNYMQRNESSFYDEKGSSRSRISTMADDFKDKETNGKILKLEKDLEQIRETVREQSMRLSETTFESARYEIFSKNETTTIFGRERIEIEILAY